MKATKSFDYYLDGNRSTTINEGDEVPEIAQEFAKKHGFAGEKTQKSAPKPQNKAAKPPQNKAK